MPFVDNGVEVVRILNRFAINMSRHLSLVKLEFTQTAIRYLTSRHYTGFLVSYSLTCTFVKASQLSLLFCTFSFLLIFLSSSPPHTPPPPTLSSVYHVLLVVTKFASLHFLLMYIIVDTRGI